jgi:cytoskeletal protein CcmA (bactofilin family)
MQRDQAGWVQKRVETRDGGPETERSQRDDREESPKTFVFQGAEFEGRLRLRESFRIDSEFRGEIESDGTVTVGELGGVEARIRARVVIIRGAVVGDVSASRQLVIHAGGRLHGDVMTPCLEIEKGAVFNGRMTMVRPEVAARSAARAGAGSEASRATAEPANPPIAPRSVQP